MSKQERLILLLERRLMRGRPELRRIVSEAHEVVIFGSTAVGCEKSDSDLDVFCVGRNALKFKSPFLDLIVATRMESESPRWRQSELASHIVNYGVWVRGNPDWCEATQLGPDAISRKKRRIEAFLRHLPTAWGRLDVGYKIKYGIKLRREAQRLILLERGVPIPPTAVLDGIWHHYQSGFDCAVSKLLAYCSPSFPVNDLLAPAIGGCGGNDSTDWLKITLADSRLWQAVDTLTMRQAPHRFSVRPSPLIVGTL